MRILLAIIFFIGFVLFAVVARWHFVCEMRLLCDNTPIEIIDERLKTLQLIEGDNILLDGYDHFSFDSASHRMNLNDNNIAFLDTLVTFIKSDTSRKLRVTASSIKNEGGQTNFQETMGLERAYNVRYEINKRGVKEESIEIIGQELSADQLLDQPVSFELFKPEPSEYYTPVNTFFDMTYDGEANFKKNSDIFTPAAPLRLYADSVSNYFREHLDLNITIIGHADSDGKERYNEKLGQRRADNAKAYFVEIGVPEDRIITGSKGETEPIAPNTSEENMLKNRRVQFIIE